MTPGTLFEQTCPKDANLNLLVLGMLHAKHYPIWWSSSWEEDCL